VSEEVFQLALESCSVLLVVDDDDVCLVVQREDFNKRISSGRTRERMRP
jgi:hypothetical protein